MKTTSTSRPQARGVGVGVCTETPLPHFLERFMIDLSPPSRFLHPPGAADDRVAQALAALRRGPIEKE